MTSLVSKAHGNLKSRPSYAGAHMRVYRARGKASDYLCDCGRQAVDWAYDHSDPDPLVENGKEYSTDETRYVAKCRFCHRKLDAQTHCQRGHEFTPENTQMNAGRRRCKTCYKEGKVNRELRGF